MINYGGLIIHIWPYSFALILSILLICLFISGNVSLELIFFAGQFFLMKTFMKHCSPPYTPESYTDWITTSVQNQYILFMNQLVFGCLESYFVMKAGVRSGDADLMIAGVLEMEKIFFFKTTNRNYQLAAFYRASDLLLMSQEMKAYYLQYHTTSATVLNSFNIPGEGNIDRFSQATMNGINIQLFLVRCLFWSKA